MNKQVIWKRLFSNAYLKEDTGCWINMFEQSHKQGRIFVDGKHIACARMSYIIMKGDIPEGLHILHTCDNPRCINPDHLFLGTNQDNVNDKMSKGRHKTAYGSKHGSAKLSPMLVKQIITLLSQEVPQRKIAKIYGVSQRTITKINLRISYLTEIDNE